MLSTLALRHLYDEEDDDQGDDDGDDDGGGIADHNQGSDHAEEVGQNVCNLDTVWPEKIAECL